MGSVYNSPGVYTTIKDFSFFVRGLSTTRAGIITTAPRGPVNKPTLITNQTDLLETFGNPGDAYIGLFAALQYLNRGTSLFITRVGNFTKTGALLGTDNFDQSAYVTINEATDTDETLKVFAISPSEDFNGMKAIISAGSSTGTFKLIVEFNGENVEQFDDLSVDSTDDRFVETVINSATSIEKSQYINVVYHTDDNGNPLNGTYELSGGENGITGLTDADYIGTATSVTYGGPSGMQTFRNKEAYPISMMACPGISSAAVINAAGAVMDYIDTGIYIIDPPQALDTSAVIDWHNGQAPYDDHVAFNSKRYAIYWPWLEFYDEFNKQNIWLPPSGSCMAQWAFTDSQFESWFAPAGLQRGHLGLPLRAEFQPDRGELDALYSGGNVINPIVTFLREGLNIWGQKTALRMNSALSSINVMRLTDFIKDSISASSRVLVFEQNDALLWNQFTQMVTPFLEDIANRRGLEEFKVVADEITTNAQRRNNLEMNAKVMFIPTKVAEKIVLDFALFPSGATFADPASF